jgi:Tol biopolymer transport system component
MNPDGSSQTRLTAPPAANYDPTWSPDGRYIMFKSNRNGDPEIYRMNADGSIQTPLAQNPSQHQCLKWPF